MANSQAERPQSRKNSTMSFGRLTRMGKKTQTGAKTRTAGEREIRLSTAKWDGESQQGHSC